MKKTLYCLLTLALIVVCVCALSLQTNATTVDSGTCGDNLTWTLDDAGTLTISGTGEMSNYWYEDAPWYDNCDSIKNLIIGDSVTTIGAYAFYGCSSLTSVTIPDSVTIIDDYVFADCYSLTSVTIPNSVTSIGEHAFYDCNLTTVTIPDSVAAIGDSAFSWCTNLTGIWVDANNSAYSSDENGVLFDKDKTVLIYTPEGVSGAYTIPNSVTIIGNEAFFNCESLSLVTIGDSVTTIGNSAFYACTSLTFVMIPDSVTTIGNSAFSWCDSLTSVTIPDSVATISGYAFAWCFGLTTVAIPDGVATISEHAFYDCNNLSSMTIPDSVTTIGNSAFEYCDSLTDVYYTGTEEQWNEIEIGEENAPLLEAKLHFETADNTVTSGTCGDNLTWTLDDAGTLTISGTGEMYNYNWENNAPWCDNCDSIKNLIIGDSVTTIGAYAFLNCYSLTSVSIPDSVTTIGDSAFYGCDSTGIWVDANNPAYSSDDRGVLFNKEKTTLIQAPGKLTGSYAVPDGVITIGDHAFKFCDFTAVTLPDSVITIGVGAFDSSKLKEVNLGSGVELIESCAFLMCWDLETITIPSSVKRIESLAFHFCDALTDVYYGGTEDQWNSIVFEEGGQPEGTIHFKQVAIGDLDGNEAVNEDDVIYLLQYLLMPEDFPVEQTVDYDKNNTVNEDDVIYLLQHLLMPEEFPL